MIVGLLNAVSRFFKREQTDFASHFTLQALPAGTPSLNTFPTKKFIGTGGVHAYRLRFQVAEDDAARVVQALAQQFPDAKPGIVQFGLLTNAAGAAANITATREFGGIVIEFITNSLALMAALDALQLKPVPPWTAFPNMKAGQYGTLKEPFEHWWSQIWLPYWTSLSAAERSRYLLAQHASAEWVAFCAWHTPHGK
jgi:hypothetical protein